MRTFSLLAATAAAAGLGSQPSTAGSQPPPLPRPSSFADRVDNPWFPLKPGTVYVYRGSSDGEAARDVLTVTQLITVFDVFMNEKDALASF